MCFHGVCQLGTKMILVGSRNSSLYIYTVTKDTQNPNVRICFKPNSPGNFGPDRNGVRWGLPFLLQKQMAFKVSMSVTIIRVC
jgi:hypothetical protein